MSTSSGSNQKIPTSHLKVIWPDGKHTYNVVKITPSQSVKSIISEALGNSLTPAQLDKVVVRNINGTAINLDSKVNPGRSIFIHVPSLDGLNSSADLGVVQAETVKDVSTETALGASAHTSLDPEFKTSSFNEGENLFDDELNATLITAISVDSKADLVDEEVAEPMDDSDDIIVLEEKASPIQDILNATIHTAISADFESSSIDETLEMINDPKAVVVFEESGKEASLLHEVSSNNEAVESFEEHVKTAELIDDQELNALEARLKVDLNKSDTVEDLVAEHVETADDVKIAELSDESIKTAELADDHQKPETSLTCPYVMNEAANIEEPIEEDSKTGELTQSFSRRAFNRTIGESTLAGIYDASSFLVTSPNDMSQPTKFDLANDIEDETSVLENSTDKPIDERGDAQTLIHEQPEIVDHQGNWHVLAVYLFFLVALLFQAIQSSAHFLQKFLLVSVLCVALFVVIDGIVSSLYDQDIQAFITNYLFAGQDAEHQH